MNGCSSSYYVVQVVGAVGAVLTSLLTAWLAHRRYLADLKQRQFMEDVRKHMLVEEREIGEGRRFSKEIDGH